MWSEFLDCLFPSQCFFCNRELQRNLHLCESCSSSRFLEKKGVLCVRCAKKLPLPDYALGEFCENCKEEQPVFSQVIATLAYEENMREIIHSFKYQKRRYLVKALGKILVSSLEENLYLDKEKMVLSFVPMSSQRFRERGFNQAKELALFVSRKTQIPILDCLGRRKSSIPQARLERRERMKNLCDTFYLKKHSSLQKKLEGKKVILIDDILTTGSTANYCAKELMKRAEEVIVGVLARS